MKDIHQSQSRKYLIKHEELSKSNYNFTAIAAQMDCEKVLAVFRGIFLKWQEKRNNWRSYSIYLGDDGVIHSAT